MKNPAQDTTSFSQRVQVSAQKESPDRLSGGEPEQEADASSAEAEPAFSEPSQATLEPVRCSKTLALIELRRQHLDKRRHFLLKMQGFRKRTEDHGEEEEQSDQPSELEAIHRELEELAVREEELQTQVRSTGSEPSPDLEEVHFPFDEVDLVTRCGGVCMLPLGNITEQEVTSSNLEPDNPPLTLIPVEGLGMTPAYTQCPSCEEVITTETIKTMSVAMWILCCMSSMLGCVAGCCLIPFFVDSLKDVSHQCPHCHAVINTFERL
ncbi:uncharacterized protein ACJ7VT_005378 [Polymixia lowei]